MNKLDFVKKVATIQQSLKAPKGQFNSFGKYKYRNCEDILEAVKPLLGDLILTIGDEIVLVGDRFYIKATATITDGGSSVSNTAFARESLTKKGQDDSQITGTASSYARKYALNGLLCIDDTKDEDSDEIRNQKTEKAKVDYKAVSDMVNQIKSKMSIYCKDMNQTQKVEAMNTILKVKAFDELQRKNSNDLKEISERIDLEINRAKKV